MKNIKVIETAEHVLPGHPDKLCDAAVDGIVEVMRQLDPRAQCGLEMACIFNQVYITGRIAASETAISTFKYRGGCKKYVKQAYSNAGYGEHRAGIQWHPLPDELQIHENLCLGPFEEGESELRHLSDDQAICVGYANMIEKTDHLPPAVWLARRIAWYLSDGEQRLAVGAGPDAKVLVRVERNGSEWKPLHVSLSLSHRQDCDWLKLRQYAEGVVEEACKDMETPELTMNGGGIRGKIGLRHVLGDCFECKAVHHLHSGWDDAGSYDARDSHAAVPDSREGSEKRAHVRRRVHESHNGLCHNSKCALTATDKPREVIAGAIEHPGGGCHTAVYRYELNAKHVVCCHPVQQSVWPTRVRCDVPTKGASFLA